MEMKSVVLEVDDRGRISVGKLLSGVERVVVTPDGFGRLIVEPAVVVRAIVPRLLEDHVLRAEIDASLDPSQEFRPRKPRPERAKAS